MKHYISLFIFMSLLLLSSCGMENLVTDGGGDSDIISFDVEGPDAGRDSQNVSTRASELKSLPDFKVYAYDASSGKPVIDGKVFSADGTSKDGTAYYWPKSGSVTFYAFAPADNSSVAFNTSSKTLTYTAPAAQGSQQDVIYATATKSRPADGKVSLAFKHATAALSVSWSRAGDLPSTTTVSVSNVKVCNVKQTGTLSFGSGMTAGGSNISSDLGTSDLGTSGLMMVAPQATSPWTSGAFTSSSGSYLAVSCKVNANGSYVVGSASADGTVYYPLSQALTAGTATTVKLVFGTKQSDGSRTFGYDANGTRISQSDAKEPVPGAVDLGLSVKWASCNLGASKPEEYGKYYAWAATTGYASSESHDFSWANTPYCNDGNYNSWSKYTSGNATLESSDDAATVNLGGSWRMPTHAEWQELSSKCTWTWTSQNGINGYKVSASNGNWIFLPAAGYRYGTSSSGVGSYGRYWSSQVFSSYVYGAWNMYFYSGNRNPDNYSHRYYGFSVRPVCP